MSDCFHAAGLPEHYPVLRRLTTALESSCYSYVPRSQMKTTLLPNEVHKEESFMSRSLYQRDKAGDTSNLAYCKIPQSSR